MIILRIILVFGLTFNIGIYAYFEFNNVNCVARDRDFLTFEYCYLRSVNRTYKYLSVKTRIYKLPIANASVMFKLSKRHSKLVFESYSVKVDACQYLKDRNNPLANLVFSAFMDYTNINHTCPYNHDISVDKLPVSHVNNIVKYIIPDGQYYLNTTWFAFNVPRCDVIVYFTKY